MKRRAPAIFSSPSASEERNRMFACPPHTSVSIEALTGNPRRQRVVDSTSDKTGGARDNETRERHDGKVRPGIYGRSAETGIALPFKVDVTERSRNQKTRKKEERKTIAGEGKLPETHFAWDARSGSAVLLRIAPPGAAAWSTPAFIRNRNGGFSYFMSHLSV